MSGGTAALHQHGAEPERPGATPERPAQPDWAAPLSAYVPRLALEWMAGQPGHRHRRVEGTLAFVDVSGFTALTERLSARGRAGAEEITDIIAATFTSLARLAAADGADLLKWGGDAALLWFEGADSAPRAARSAWRMVQSMRRIGQLRTSVGRVQLQVSVGIHSGQVECYLLGDLHRELVVAGPGATRTAEMEGIAQAGQVVVSLETAVALRAAGEDRALGEPVGGGILLCAEPRAEPLQPAAALRTASETLAAALLPERARRYLLAGGEQAEHRPAAVGFAQLAGLDAAIARLGAPALASLLDPVVCQAQESAERHGASFHATDLSADGVKIILLGGVPTLHGNDADRLLRTAIEILEAVPTSAAGAAGIVARAGVNAGKIFVFSSDLGLGGRRIYSITGDAVNLAARVCAAASVGEVRCTVAAKEALRSPFGLTALEPFSAKGKSEPVLTFAVRGEGAPAGTPGGRRAAFVGRDAELALLVGAARRALEEGAGGVIELIGAPGTGKSRLVEEALARWQLPARRVAGDAFGVNRPYRSLRPFARQLLGLDNDAEAQLVADVLLATLQRHVPSLRPFAPLLADVFDVTLSPTRESTELEPRFRRPRLESAFCALAGELLRAPTAIVIEDVHGLDEASASLALRISEEAAQRPWLVVATRRPDGPGVPGGVLESRAVVELGPLGDEEAAALLGEVLGERFPPAERQALVERAGGNPLFLIELGRAALESGSTEELPDALEALLAVQVDRLSPSDRRVLRTASVLGLRFDASLLLEVVDDEALLDSGVWDRLDGFVRRDGTVVAFHNALLRDAAYEGLSFRRRRELHVRAAEAIERRSVVPDEAVELLSWHWMAAERWEQAWRCARLAGERAAALYANRDAATHFRRALEAARHVRGVDRSELVSVGELLGDVSELAGGYEPAARAYALARRRAGSPVDRARLLRKTGVLYERRGRYAQALRCYGVARRALPPATTAPPPTTPPPAAERAAAVEFTELGLAAAGVRHRQGRLRDSMADAALAGDEARRASYRRGLAHAEYLQHLNSVFLYEPRDALALDALEIFVELGDLVGQGNVLNNLGISAYFAGRWEESLQRYAASRDLRERSGDLVGAATEDNNIGEILSDQGRYDEAERVLLAARATWRSVRYLVGDALATSNLGRLAARRGDAAAGRALLLEARARLEQIHSAALLAETELRLVECTLAEGDFAAAAGGAASIAAGAAGRRGRERIHAAALRLRASALIGLRCDAEAVPVLDEAVQHLQACGDRYELGVALTERCELRRRRGDVLGASADQATAGELLAGLGVRVPAILRRC